MTSRRLGIRLAVLAATCLLTWAGLTVLRDHRDTASLVESRRLMEAGDLPGALPRLRTLSKRHADDPEIAFRLGVCAHAAGDFASALESWGRVGPRNAWSRDAVLARAQTLAGNLGRLAEAESLLVDALRDDGPDQTEIRHTLSQIYFLQGRRYDMRRLIESAWRTAPDPIAELQDHWRTDNATPLVDYLRNELERAGRLAPEDDRVWLGRAFLATQSGHTAEAVGWLDRCVQRRPNDPAVWRARLDLGRSTNDREAAEEALRHLPAEAFTETERRELAAWLAGVRGDTAAERQALAALVALAPGETQALDRLASLDWEAGRADEAAADRRRKAVADNLKERYLRILEGTTIEPRQFAELGELAEGLGRTFEAQGWWVLASRVPGSERAATLAMGRLRLRPPAATPPRGMSLAESLGESPGATRLAGGENEGLPRLLDRGSRESAQVRIPRFRDDAAAVGLDFVFDNGLSVIHQLPETTAGGVALLDYDGDGALDVFAIQGGTFPPEPGRAGGDRLFRNRSDGTFEDVTDSAGIARLVKGYGHGVAVGDFDNDGHPDLFLTRWRAYQLLRNRGDGTFEDATESVGLAGDRDWPTSAAFADLDNDGDLDLYVCHYLEWDSDHPVLCERKPRDGKPVDPDRRYDYCMPHPFRALPDHLFRNDGGRFVDVTSEAGIVDTDGRGLGVVAADVDNDGLVDLFVANDTSANYLFRNLGGMKFAEVGFASGVACNAGGAFQAGMGTAVGDLDGDGLPDLFVTNFYGESTSYFRNLGPGMFADQTAGSGLAAPSRFLLGFGIALLDANADGRLDLATANGHVVDDRPDFPWMMPALLVVGGPDGRLRDVGKDAGDPWSVPRLGRALAAGDLDNDGRIDLILAGQRAPLAYLHNQTEGGRTLTLALQGTASNRDAVGAVVTVTAGRKAQKRWRYGGGSFQSAADPRLHFGLGDATRAETVEVRWPSGRVDTFANLETGRGYRLREGDAEPAPWKGPDRPASP